MTTALLTSNNSCTVVATVAYCIALFCPTQLAQYFDSYTPRGPIKGGQPFAEHWRTVLLLK